mmetsp:Transcript_25461/g.85178  ORF Transcript_25461/g.85178 Transcript_25461/m.85178 type:complete len:229 (+) Transcript_25461:197-883(+)
MLDGIGPLHLWPSWAPPRAPGPQRPLLPPPWSMRRRQVEPEAVRPVAVPRRPCHRSGRGRGAGAPRVSPRLAQAPRTRPRRRTPGRRRISSRSRVARAVRRPYPCRRQCRPCCPRPPWLLPPRQRRWGWSRFRSRQPWCGSHSMSCQRSSSTWTAGRTVWKAAPRGCRRIAPVCLGAASPRRMERRPAFPKARSCSLGTQRGTASSRGCARCGKDGTTWTLTRSCSWA